jgi:hypothetical protein
MSKRVADVLVETLQAAVVEMAVYTARAMLHGKGGDVWESLVENTP